MSADVERSPADVLRLVVAAVVLVVVTVLSRVFGDSVSSFVADVLEGLKHFPSVLVTLVVLVGVLLGLGLIVVGGVLAVLQRRWRLLVGLAVAVVVSVPLVWATQPSAGEAASSVADLQDWLGDVTIEGPSAYTLAAVVAITAAVTPWAARRWRRAWWAAALGVAMAHLVGAAVSFETVLAVLCGWTAGAASVVALGAPSRRPSQEAVVAGLESVGLDLVRLEPASVDARGSTPYFGDLADGTPVFVKTLGVDERSADLLFRMYRSIQPRDLHDERPFSSLRRTVEHEALVALVARESGIRTPPLLGFAPAEPNGFTLAYQAVAGRSLDREPDAADLDELIRAVWGQLLVLRRTRIAHRDLRLANVFVGEDREVWIIDFGFSEIAADDVLLDGDVAELLASTTTLIGADRALAAALDVVGADALHRSGARLRPALLSGATRTTLGQQPGVLDDLRARVTGLGPG
ncbi:MAG TPA: phosphotransferase [Acidimicrobiales bacterium]